MKKMAAGSFKTNCLAIMDEVQAKRETIVITKHGKPVAKLVPVTPRRTRSIISSRAREPSQETSFPPRFLRRSGAN